MPPRSVWVPFLAMFLPPPLPSLMTGSNLKDLFLPLGFFGRLLTPIFDGRPCTSLVTPTETVSLTTSKLSLILPPKWKSDVFAGAPALRCGARRQRPHDQPAHAGMAGR